MKVVFLDIDGVLVTDETIHKPLVPVDGDTGIPFRRLGYPQFDPQCVARLNRITETAGAVIILSSTWRILPGEEEWERLKKYLSQTGVVAPVVDRTPREGPRNEDGFATRGMEIQAYLDKHPEVDKFIIIDDDSDMDHLAPFLIHTTWVGGLEDRHVGHAISMLS
jgi:hypothetical protein